VLNAVSPACLMNNGIKVKLPTGILNKSRIWQFDETVVNSSGQ